MRNIIIAAATAAISVSASAQNFPFNTFEGQVDNAPYNGVIETPWNGSNGNPMSVSFLDVDGDGRFDYMGQGTTVVDLDGWHEDMDWRNSTNQALYSTEQEAAFDFATTFVGMPRAIPGETGNWNLATAKFEYLAEDIVKTKGWKSPVTSVPANACNNPPVLCGDGVVAPFDHEDMTCVFKKFAEKLLDLGHWEPGCRIVIIDKNDRLRVHGYVYKEIISCDPLSRDYACYLQCGYYAEREYPVDYKDNNGDWKTFPIGVSPNQHFGVDDKGMPGLLGKGRLFGDCCPPYGDGRQDITGHPAAACYWATWFLNHLSCKTNMYQWIEH